MKLKNNNIDNIFKDLNIIGREYEIEEIKDLYKMGEKDIKKYAECSALAYNNYPLFQYVTKGKCDYKVIERIISASIRSMKGKIISFSTDKDANAIAIFTPPNYTGSKIIPFLLGGGLKLILTTPLSTSYRLMIYENHAMKLKKQFTNHNCWYLYNLTVKPEYQHTGKSSLLLKPMFEYLDKIGQDCYLETHDEKNIEIYEHFGFELLDISEIPKSKVKHYAMLRKAKQK